MGVKRAEAHKWGMENYETKVPFSLCASNVAKCLTRCTEMT